MMVVAGLGSLKRLEAVQMLQPYLDDPDVKAEAALAIVQVAPALAGAKNAAVIKSALERIAATEKDEEVRGKAARLAKGGGAAAPKGKAGKAGTAAPAVAAGQLFNGKDLGNWDGDPAVWRVRDGVIVGGSLLGNSRNEFLATTRRYQNFVLRLEYRLVGTEGFVNGGVQFRSVRVTQPPNEMSGTVSRSTSTATRARMWLGGGSGPCGVDHARSANTPNRMVTLTRVGSTNPCKRGMPSGSVIAAASSGCR